MVLPYQKFMENLCKTQYGHHNWSKKSAIHRCTRCGKTKDTKRRSGRRVF